MRKVILLIVLVLLSTLSITASNICSAETYDVEILTADTGRLFYGTWWHIGEFAKTAYIQAKVTLKNNVGISKQVRVTCTLMDELQTPCGFTEKTVTIPANTVQDVILDPLQIASYAVVGQAMACICAIRPDGAPYCPEYDVPFYIMGKAFYNLTFETYFTNGTAISGAIIWIDEVQYSSPVTVNLLQGIHVVKANNEYPFLGDYKFLYWEDNTIDNPRSVTLYTNKVIKAYYNYYVEIIAAETGRYFYGAWWPINKFAKTAYLEVKVTLRNNALVSKWVKVTCTLMDEVLQPVGFTQKNVTIPASTTQNVILGPVQVASYAVVGQAMACICAIRPEGAAYCPEYDVPFQILGSVSYGLTIQTYLTSGSEIMGVNLWVDGGSTLTSPTTVTVLQGTHVVKVTSIFYSGNYRYTFQYWENGYTSNPRAVDVFATKTIIAYYDREYIGGGGGCPILSVFDGSKYVEEGLLDIHQPDGIDVITHYTLVIKPKRVGATYLLRLTEHPQTHSYIDQVKLYALLQNGKTIQLPLISAIHSRYGNVKQKLLFSDDVKTDIEANESIDLKFLALPNIKIKAFIFEIEGHNRIIKV